MDTLKGRNPVGTKVGVLQVGFLRKLVTVVLVRRIAGPVPPGVMSLDLQSSRVKSNPVRRVDGPVQNEDFRLPNRTYKVRDGV